MREGSAGVRLDDFVEDVDEEGTKGHDEMSFGSSVAVAVVEAIPLRECLLQPDAEVDVFVAAAAAAAEGWAGSETLGAVFFKDVEDVEGITALPGPSFDNTARTTGEQNKGGERVTNRDAGRRW